MQDGVSVTLSLPLNTEPAIHNPTPAIHYMTTHDDDGAANSGSLHIARDYIGVDYHSEGHTHLDALCHIAYQGLPTMRSRKPASVRRARQSTRLTRSRLVLSDEAM